MNHHTNDPKKAYRRIAWISVAISIVLYGFVLLNIDAFSEEQDTEQWQQHSFNPDIRFVNRRLSQWTGIEWNSMTHNERQFLIIGMMLSTWVIESTSTGSANLQDLQANITWLGKLNAIPLEVHMDNMNEFYRLPMNHPSLLWQSLYRLSAEYREFKLDLNQGEL